jgi:hypothetical protein
LTTPQYMFIVGIFLIGACLSFSAREPRVRRTDLPRASKATAAPSH